MPDSNEKIKEQIEDIRRNLIARIIPSMPFGKIRKFIIKIIDNFEFEQYFKKTINLTRKATAKSIFKEIDKKNVECVGMTEGFRNGSKWCNGLWKGYIKELKKKFGVEVKE